MKLILDSNIVISALIKDSTTRTIILQSGWAFYYPEMSLHEIRKYKSIILQKSGLKDNDYQKLMDSLLNHIVLIPNEKILINLQRAKEIMLEIDPKDVIFVGAQLSVSGSKIWSDDKDFEKQDIIPYFNTKEIVRIFDLSK